MKTAMIRMSSMGFLAVVWLAAGCASSTDKRVDAKIALEAPVKNSEALGKIAHDLVAENPNLTPAQKEKLYALQKETRTKLDDFREQSLKIRALLLQEVANDQYNEKEVRVIKKKLKKNEDDRLNAYFSAIDEANKILGRQSNWERRKEFMQDFVGMREGY